MKKIEKPEGLEVVHDLFASGLTRRGIADTLQTEYGIAHTTSYRWIRDYLASDKHLKHIKDLRTNLGNSLLVIFNRNFERGNRAHDRVAMEAFDRIVALFPQLKDEQEKKVEPITVKLVGYDVDKDRSQE